MVAQSSELKMADYAPVNDEAQLRTKVLHFLADGVPMESFIALPVSATADTPAILICYNWMGPSAYFEHRAKALASLGYVAMVADPYGTSVRPQNTDEAGGASGAMYKDAVGFRARMQRALDVLLEQPEVDSARVGAIGYCFGGTAVLELARDGAPLQAVVSFHGGLKTQQLAEVAPRASLLVLHGDRDPFVPAAEVAGFLEEMRSVEADFQFVRFSGAVHSFSNPNTAFPGKAEYHPASAVRSWQMATSFLNSILQ